MWKILLKKEKTSESKGRKRKNTSDDLLAKLNREEAKERRHFEKQAI